MRVVRFKKQNFISYGFLEEDVILEVSGNPYDVDHYVTGRDFPLDQVKLLAPVEPSKIIAAGLNYKNHAKELGMPLPEEPIIFLKPPSSVVGPDGNIVIPKQSKQVDYEAELAFVVGKKAKDVTSEEARNYIYGYTCANDVTARDLQETDGQWSRAKGFDTFCPVGPWVDSEADVSNLAIKMLVNAQVKQQSNTSEMIFTPEDLLSFISSVMTLFPGDVVLTGTPPGVGPLGPGQEATVWIENIGSLTNTISDF